MSIQDMLTSPLFKRDEAGRVVMYPNGALGGGYFVPDTATERRMRRTLMWAVIGSGLFGGIGMVILTAFFGQVYEWTLAPWLIAMAALVAFNFAYRMVAKRLARGMTPAAGRLGMVEAFKRQAEAMPRWYLWFSIILSPLLVVGSLMWMMAEPSVMSYLVGSFGIVLFAAATAQAVYGFRRERVK
jgi:hypothetical protein